MIESDILSLTKPSQILTKNTFDQSQYPKHISLEEFQNINFKNLKDKKKETENAIQAVTARINFIKTKEDHTQKKYCYIRKRLSQLSQIKSKTLEYKHQNEDVSYSIKQLKKKQIEQKQKKAEFNKLLKQHLQCNKKIIFLLHKDKIEETSRRIKLNKGKNTTFINTMRETLAQENFRKVHKIQQDGLVLQQKKRIYFLQKLKNTRLIKLDELHLQQKLKKINDKRLTDLNKSQTFLKDLRKNVSSNMVKLNKNIKNFMTQQQNFLEKTLVILCLNFIPVKIVKRIPINNKFDFFYQQQSRIYFVSIQYIIYNYVQLIYQIILLRKLFFHYYQISHPKLRYCDIEYFLSNFQFLYPIILQIYQVKYLIKFFNQQDVYQLQQYLAYVHQVMQQLFNQLHQKFQWFDLLKRQSIQLNFQQKLMSESFYDEVDIYPFYYYFFDQKQRLYHYYCLLQYMINLTILSKLLKILLLFVILRFFMLILNQKMLIYLIHLLQLLFDQQNQSYNFLMVGILFRLIILQQLNFIPVNTYQFRITESKLLTAIEVPLLLNLISTIPIRCPSFCIIGFLSKGSKWAFLNKIRVYQTYKIQSMVPAAKQSPSGDISIEEMHQLRLQNPIQPKVVM